MTVTGQAVGCRMPFRHERKTRYEHTMNREGESTTNRSSAGLFSRVSADLTSAAFHCAVLVLTLVSPVQAGINVWTSYGYAPKPWAATALAIDPTMPNTLYAGADNDRGTYGYSLLKSTDAGGTWSAADTGLPYGSRVYSLVVEPTMPSTLYAATYNSVTTSDAVFKSTDSGSTWSAASPGLPHTIYSLVIDPTGSSSLYVGTDDYGVFKTTDGGGTWTAADTGLPSNTTISALVIDPATPSTVYAAGENALGPDISDSIFKSTDGGNTWSTVSSGLPAGTVVRSLVMDPTLPSTLYAGAGWNGVFKTTDAGSTWSANDTGLPTHDPINVLVVDASRPGTLYAGTTYNGVFNSTDAGDTWRPVNAGLPGGTYISTLAIDPTTSTVLYAGTLGYGVFKSTDAGGTWSASYSGLPGGSFDVGALAVDINTPGALYAGTTFGVFKSTDAGGTWSGTGLLRLPPAGCGIVNCGADTTVVALAIDPAMPRRLYAAGKYKFDWSSYASVFSRSTDAGATWSPMDVAVQFVSALVMDPTAPSTVYATTMYGVYKSTNAGDTWTRIVVPFPTFVTTLAIDPGTPNTVYAGTSTFGVLKSTDAGGTWTQVSAYNAFFELSITALAVDPTSPSTLYAATYGSPPFAMGASVYKSTDAGSTWSRADTGLHLSSETSVTEFTVDPTAPGTLYTGTADGVFETTDGANSWHALNTGLPAGAAVAALAINPTKPTTLYAASAGVFSLQQAPVSCVGDCDGNGQITVDELLTLVNFALGNADGSACANGGLPLGGNVDVAVILQAVNNALNGCGG